MVYLLSSVDFGIYLRSITDLLLSYTKPISGCCAHHKLLPQSRGETMFERFISTIWYLGFYLFAYLTFMLILKCGHFFSSSYAEDLIFVYFYFSFFLFFLYFLKEILGDEDTGNLCKFSHVLLQSFTIYFFVISTLSYAVVSEYCLISKISRCSMYIFVIDFYINLIWV